MDLPPPIVHEIVIDHSHIASKHLAEMSADDLDRDWKLDEFFGNVYVINLPQATERLLTVTKSLHEIGMKTFQVFRAVDGRKELPPTIWRKFWKNWQGLNLMKPGGRAAFDRQRKGEAGCFMSHYRLICGVKKQFEEAVNALKKAKAQGNAEEAALAAKKARRYSCILILEDDCGFGILNKNGVADLRGCGVLLRQAFQELPPNWDMLYFTLLTRDPTHPYSEHLCHITQTYGTHAYAVNYTMYHALIKFLKRIESPVYTPLLPVDKELSGVYPGHQIFALLPSLAFQGAGKSFIIDKSKERPIQKFK